MSDQSSEALREQVRSRYAEKARVVLAGSGQAGCGEPAAAECCGPAWSTDSAAGERPGTGSAAPGSAAGERPGTGSAAPGSAAGERCGTGSAALGSAALGSAALDSAGCFGESVYGEGETDGLPAEAVLASLGCGNPLAVADLHEGERVLDLGSGGGIDVLLSARRVGPSGFVWGVDMTDDMLALARANAAKAGVTNVEFVQGEIEALPLPNALVDVVISNCVINLSVDKPAVLAEMFRVLAPGGRIGISDVVAEDHLTPADRAAAGSYVGCIAGALSRAEYLEGLSGAGFTDASVTFTTRAAPGLHSAIIRAVKPAQLSRAGRAGSRAARVAGEVGDRGGG